MKKLQLIATRKALETAYEQEDFCLALALSRQIDRLSRRKAKKQLRQSDRRTA